jgi:hypothetical protein
VRGGDRHHFREGTASPGEGKGCNSMAEPAAAPRTGVFVARAHAVLNA